MTSIRQKNHPAIMSHTPPATALLAAMAEAGIEPQDNIGIIADGQIHRFRVAGDKPGSRNGWYVLHQDARPYGVYGSWRTGERKVWSTGGQQNLSPAEQMEVRRRSFARHMERKRQTRIKHETAAERAAGLWGTSTPADPNHPYLQRKKIPPFGARQSGDDLVLRLIDLESRTISSLQYIRADGTKRLLSGGRKQGCVIHINGRLPEARRVLICEGFATGASLACTESESLVLAAIDAGNLHSVATEARRAWPDRELVICADADPVGKAKGRAAAIAAGALIAVPEFPEGTEGSDWNDYVNAGLAEPKEFNFSRNGEGRE
jgi:putative DNA primase/helicase